MKRSRVKARSARNVDEGKIRAEIRATIPRCEVGPILERVGISFGCRVRVEGLHERRKAGSGGTKVRRANLLGSCNRCNDFIECEPLLVRERTGSLLVVRQGDDEWDALGRRHDRLT